jgi:hypothetical protein
MGRNISRVYLVVYKYKKKGLGTLIPQETRVIGLIPKTYRELPLPITIIILYSNPI